MLKKLLFIFGFTFELILLIGLLGGITAYIDYLNIISGTVPMFNIKKYNESTKIVNYKGLFYDASRKVRYNKDEDLTESKNIKFSIFDYDIKVPNSFKKVGMDYTLEAKEIENCTANSSLYYADSNNKIYIYCLEDIKINGDNIDSLINYLKKDGSLIDDILNKFGYLGLNPNDNTLMFTSREDNFTNIGLKAYQCNYDNNKDIYIGPSGMNYQADFCINKDDDFKFMATVVEELPEGFTLEADQYDLLFEDENNRYLVEKGKIDYIYIVSGEHRGLSEVRYSLRDVVNNNILTMKELQEIGLKLKIEKK